MPIIIRELSAYRVPDGSLLYAPDGGILYTVRHAEPPAGWATLEFWGAERTSEALRAADPTRTCRLTGLTGVVKTFYPNGSWATMAHAGIFPTPDEKAALERIIAARERHGTGSRLFERIRNDAEANGAHRIIVTEPSPRMRNFLTDQHFSRQGTSNRFWLGPSAGMRYDADAQPAQLPAPQQPL